jgi:hypothetical protein
MMRRTIVSILRLHTHRQLRYAVVTHQLQQKHLFHSSAVRWDDFKDMPKKIQQQPQQDTSQTDEKKTSSEGQVLLPMT